MRTQSNDSGALDNTTLKFSLFSPFLFAQAPLFYSPFGQNSHERENAVLEDNRTIPCTKSQLPITLRYNSSFIVWYVIPHLRIKRKLFVSSPTD
jgi:hypothetical protein